MQSRGSVDSVSIKSDLSLDKSCFGWDTFVNEPMMSRCSCSTFLADKFPHFAFRLRLPPVVNSMSPYNKQAAIRIPLVISKYSLIQREPTSTCSD